MKNLNYNEMITVRDYVKSIRYEADAETLNENAMLRADDYAAYLHQECVEYRPASLITVQEYVAALYAGKELTAEEVKLAERIEKSIEAKKDEKAA